MVAPSSRRSRLRLGSSPTTQAIEGAVVVQQIERETGSIGLNAATGEFEDLMKAGVIDPAKVTRAALQNAASIAGLLLTTEAIVADKPEEDSGARRRHAWRHGRHGWHGRHDVALLRTQQLSDGPPFGAVLPRQVPPASCRDVRRLRYDAGMDRPPADPAKLLAHWMEWERGETPPGRVISNLKTGGLRELLEHLAARSA